MALGALSGFAPGSIDELEAAPPSADRGIASVNRIVHGKAEPYLTALEEEHYEES
jgi:hypothetical protein